MAQKVDKLLTEIAEIMMGNGILYCMMGILYHMFEDLVRPKIRLKKRHETSNRGNSLSYSPSDSEELSKFSSERKAWFDASSSYPLCNGWSV